MCLGTDRATERAAERAPRGEHTFRVFVKQPASLLESSPSPSPPSSSLYLSLVKSMNAIWYGHGNRRLRRLALYIGSKTNHTRSAKVRTCGRSKHAVHGGRHRPNIKQARRGRQGEGELSDGRVGKRIDWKEGGRVYVVLTTLPCSSARQLLPSLFPPSTIPFDGLFIHLSPSFDREEGRRGRDGGQH